MTQRRSPIVSERMFSEILETLGEFLSQDCFAFVRQATVHTGVRQPILFSIIRALRHLGPAVHLCIILSALLMAGPWFSGSGRRSGPYLISLSHNNERAFNRLSDILKRHGEGSIAINSTKFGLWRRLTTAHRIAYGGDLARLLRRKGHSDDAIFLNQLLACSMATLFWDDLQNVHPPWVGVANDHSAPSVALLAVARALGIPTFYVQHAPVTDRFPPLNVDLALLENQYSIDSYIAAARRCGKAPLPPDRMCLLPSRPDVQTVSYRQVPTDRPLRVCIALTKHTNITTLTDLLHALSAVPEVAHVTLRLHPQDTANLQSLQSARVSMVSGTVPLASVAQECDLFLVSNSGVAIELLQLHAPTMFVADLDFLEADYYGLVRAGVLPCFDMRLLQDRATLAALFDSRWVESLAGLSGPDPELTLELEQAIVTRLSAKRESSAS